MKHSGYADLPLHGGIVPRWLADRMKSLGTLIIESLILNYGKDEVLKRLSDPLWFQSFGAVLGMDWHSSGITTSVMYALKRGLNERAHELGICVCGGRGKYSRKTPEELLFLADATGLDGDELVRSSKLCAKIDSVLLQDGFQLYQHNFIITNEGNWAVVQQGMNAETQTARRYHWCSSTLPSFVEEPHTAVIGENQGKILNLTDKKACSTREAILELSKEKPAMLLSEIQKILDLQNSHQQLSLFENEVQKETITFESGRNLVMPRRHNVQKEDIDLKRLGAVLVTAYESPKNTFEDFVLTEGLGPRTLQSLALVSEIVHGTASRFNDPARFSFAHGGKDGQPFPVPLKIYDESVRVLHDSIERAKLGYNDKSDCLRRLHSVALNIEEKLEPEANFDEVIAHEKKYSKMWGGKVCGH
ncbi:MAG: DUF763 domain-containing protein [Spirochaetaceae bacterium]|nr:DUF763 domain-containing protein [Spirochaetaceae bacterium]